MNKIYTHKGLNELPKYIPQGSGVFVIIDNNLKPYYGKYFKMFPVIEINTSENNKTLSIVQFILERLLKLDADRNCFIIGVGGGITTDIAGFAASIYKRGVKFGFVPTTLLAQVDASIGGKNGVNFHSYKNIIGTITQPEWIYICSDVLQTLHSREFKAGIAEVLKTFILFDKEYYKKGVDYFAELEQYHKEHHSYLLRTNEQSNNFSQPSNLLHSNHSPHVYQIYKQELLTNIIGRCAEYKCGVVERDQFEKGERRLLNLGHTFAHAIEKLCGEQKDSSTMHSIKSSAVPTTLIDDTAATPPSLMHGEAVSIGMILAAKIAEKLSPCGSNFAAQLKADFLKVGLPVEIPANLSMHNLIQAIGKDKKVAGANIHFILPKNIGYVEDRIIPLKQLEEISHDLR